MKDFKLTLKTLGYLVTQLTTILQDGKTYVITCKEYSKKRTITANAQCFVWYPQIAKFYGEDAEFIRKMMKHDIAWPILERGQCEYSIKMRWMLDKGGYNTLPMDKKINMVDMFGVTRFMTTKQHNAFRDEIQIYWAKNGLKLNYLNEV